MSEPDEARTSVAQGRSRRGPSKQVSARQAALAQLRKAQTGDYHYQVEDELRDSVYEYVSAEEYGRRVQARQTDGFIVEDESGLYVEDGREIFDEEAADSADEAGSGPAARAGPRAQRAQKRGHIKHMLLAMPAKKAEGGQSIGQDEVSPGEQPRVGAGGGLQSSGALAGLAHGPGHWPGGAWGVR
eukprot:snap_masked-scaffold252_size238019-processed-gene-1.19 protein:Tk06207 transcript:snap_masked-scaffold252_size238019-processed-gene-1.19-mRNA-1 annotation:"dna polymerase alpha catalytic subunit"